MWREAEAFWLLTVLAKDLPQSLRLSKDEDRSPRGGCPAWALGGRRGPPTPPCCHPALVQEGGPGEPLPGFLG